MCGNEFESENLLKTNKENTECTMAYVENAKMTEVDENEEIETVHFDCMGGVWGRDSLDIIDS